MMSGVVPSSLHVLLRAERALRDRDVGEVHIPLSELLSGAPDGPVPAKFVAYQVRKISSGKPQGVLNLSYKLGEVANGYAPAPPPSPPTPSLHRPPRTRLLQARLMPTRLPPRTRLLQARPTRTPPCHRIPAGSQGRRVPTSIRRLPARRRQGRRCLPALIRLPTRGRQARQGGRTGDGLPFGRSQHGGALR
ncbi:uncharacterized protein [Zea mays]|jgi:hypothetical protein|uniref:uncharacterized protein n=1 Tax=Zea mays TaxID=4577 RepID=UPI0004DEAF21|nr:uncharacterized protein LOC103628068 [Zea mays]